MTRIAERQGLFGPVTVVDAFPERKVFACGNIQGAALLHPAAPEVFPGARPGPGPLSDIPYQHAWLLAGADHASGHGLMLGLGCGSGATALLYQFPRLRLDVVEIDPLAAELARAHFPAVEYLEGQGRLRLFVGDAVGFVHDAQERYDFVLVDLDGGPVRAVLTTPAFQDGLWRLSDARWINTIAAKDDAFLAALVRAVDARGGISEVYSSVPVEAWLPVRRNWVLATAAASRDARDLMPFAGLQGAHVEHVRAAFRRVVQTRLDRARVGALWGLDMS
jgi:spermidine synthase